jgi:hypothetical protein
MDVGKLAKSRENAIRRKYRRIESIVLYKEYKGSNVDCNITQVIQSTSQYNLQILINVNGV